MTLLASLLFYSLMALSALLIAFVFIPLHVVAKGEIDEYEADGVVDLYWMWGGVDVRVFASAQMEIAILGRVVHRRQLERTKSAEVKKVKEVKEVKKSRSSPGGQILMQHRQTLRRVLSQIVDALEPDAMIWGEVGLSRADQTAYLGMLLRELDSLMPGVKIDIVPNYIRQSLRLRGALRVFVWPAGLLAVATRLAFERETRDLLRALRPAAS